MKGSWEFVEHTADVGLLAHGRDAAEALANAGAALFDLMIGLSEVSEGCARRIEVVGSDPADLLVAWLSELLYLFDVEGLVFRRFEVTLVEQDWRVVAVGRGERFDPSRHELSLGVKAATYHEAALERVVDAPEPRWRARVILDV